VWREGLGIYLTETTSVKVDSDSLHIQHIQNTEHTHFNNYN